MNEGVFFGDCCLALASGLCHTEKGPVTKDALWAGLISLFCLLIYFLAFMIRKYSSSIKPKVQFYFLPHQEPHIQNNHLRLCGKKD
jgi:hypothetical protein